MGREWGQGDDADDMTTATHLIHVDRPHGFVHTSESLVARAHNTRSVTVPRDVLELGVLVVAPERAQLQNVEVLYVQDFDGGVIR